MKHKQTGGLKTLFVPQHAAQEKAVARNLRVTHDINIYAASQNIGITAKCGTTS